MNGENRRMESTDYLAPMRFHAYGVGLPKTGSTSLAQTFSRYQTRHEWDMIPLINLGQALKVGRIDEDKFWQVAGPRFTPPFLELDVCTAHHLYVDVLTRRYSQSLVIHLVRDVGSWINSMLDMGWRMRRARAQVSMSTDDWAQASQVYAGITVTADPSDVTPDTGAIPGLMEAWGNHMKNMANQLPPDRTLRIATKELSGRWPEIAEFLGADFSKLDLSQERSRVSPVRCDRLRQAPESMVEAYNKHCAELMIAEFPMEHEVILRSLTSSPDPNEWSDYVVATDNWVARAIAHYGPVMTQ